MTKRAFITGITGQDGSYLAERLLSEGYEVHGLIRRSSTPNTQRIDHIKNRLNLHVGDILDGGLLKDLIHTIEPDEVYHLAAQSQVGDSFKIPVYTADVIALGTLRLLEAIRGTDIKFYNASTSEMFGNSPAPQSEFTPFNPVSPYGVAKVFAHQMIKSYREAYGMFAVNGILFNHESPRRGLEFVTRKISHFVAQLVSKRWNGEKLHLGYLWAKRDWGFAPDYVRAMRMMMQMDQPDDYVIATGETHTVKEFLEEAFKFAVKEDWNDYVVADPSLNRPKELFTLRGNYTKAKEKLGWKPMVGFYDLVKIMVTADAEGWK